MPEIRAYCVINASQSVSDQAWDNLRQAARLQPMLSAIIQAGIVRDLPHLRVRDTRQSLAGQYQMVRFVVHEDDQATLLALLDQLCATRGITGTVRQKFRGLIEAELRDAAVSIGYTAQQASNLSVTIRGYGNMATAIAEFETYVAGVRALWETANA